MVAPHTDTTSYHGQTLLATTCHTATQWRPPQGAPPSPPLLCNTHHCVSFQVVFLPSWFLAQIIFVIAFFQPASMAYNERYLSKLWVDWSHLSSVNKMLKIKDLRSITWLTSKILSPFGDLWGWKLKIKFQVINLVFWDSRSNSTLKLRIARF